MRRYVTIDGELYEHVPHAVFQRTIGRVELPTTRYHGHHTLDVMVSNEVLDIGGWEDWWWVVVHLPEKPEIPACATHVELLIDPYNLPDVEDDDNMHLNGLYIDWHILDRREEEE